MIVRITCRNCGYKYKVKRLNYLGPFPCICPNCECIIKVVKEDNGKQSIQSGS